MKNIAALLLAAGSSRRFGTHDKLCALVNGKPIIAHAASKITSQLFSDRIAVLNVNHSRLQALLNNAGFKTAINPNAKNGMGSSLAVGIRVIAKNRNNKSDAICVFLGDMPAIRAETIETMVKATDNRDGPYILVPCFKKQRGHPVIFTHHFFRDLSSLSGDEGGRNIMKKQDRFISTIEVDDPGILFDIDLTGDLEKYNSNKA